MSTPKQLCMNIKSRKFINQRCPYVATKGEFCSRHYKNPIRYTIPNITRSITNMAKKIQRFWKLRHGLKYFKERTPAFFIRSLCHNDTEIASFEPLTSIPNDYFFVVKDMNRFWGFDIRTLVIQYENEGKFENPYTKEICSSETVEAFRCRLEFLRRIQKPTHYEELTGLTLKQSWNLRVLDMCLRLDMLGYRIATQWFTDLDISSHKVLYEELFLVWRSPLLTNETREIIVPGYSNNLFKWSPEKIIAKNDVDSIRRTNLNVMERLISSAIQQSDKTLGAMYCVMALSKVSYRCRAAYPWFN